ncbi:cadmium resistance transporter [Catellatospora tritici]|uniref:cadmium resistance transporter n=1 Tax=Catellatospora tritici TaxID=2851566 RepID=UPI001C2D2E67|nr:cadmium resistance transporter [Catellatospora tritici]MBV1850178.1 cadmium resistance transporter [Catellatospora tritici]
MNELLGTVLAAIGVFAGTNIDDLVVLTVLFLSARTSGVPRPAAIWVGQYAGIAALTAVSAAAALGLAVVPGTWVGLLGLVPLALGVRTLLRNRHDGAEAAPAVPARTAWAVAGVTIANGADNIAVYTPVLRTAGVAASVVIVAVFAVLTAVWCLAGAWLGGHRHVVAMLEKAGHWLVPAVFILIGVVIIAESGVLAQLG